MTTEIEKMYKLVGVKKQEYGYCDADDACVYPSKSMGIECERNCPFWVTEKIDYPNFTEKKQLELIKWLIEEIDYITLWNFNNSNKPYDFNLGKHNSGGKTFEDALAGLINDLWQELTGQEKEEIRRILK